MTWNDFFQEVKSDTLDSVYLFTGPEEWIKNEALESLRAHLLPPGLEQLNDLTIEGSSAQQIIDAAETMPMMCDRRIVTVRDWAPLLPGNSRNEDSEVERLKKWLENPPESCVTIFYIRGECDGRKKATKLLKSKVTVIQFDYLTDSELKKWATRRLKSSKKKISASAVSTLSFMAGSDLTRLAGELDKLIAYTEDRAEITEQDVRTIVSASLEYSIFELLNQLLEHKLGEAQRMANNLLQDGQRPAYILATLTSQMRQLAHMRYALDSGKSVRQVQELLKIKNSYAADQIARRCKSRPAVAFKRLYEECVALDFDIKSGLLRDSVALNAALIKIASN